MKKKFMLLVLCLALAVSLLPAAALAVPSDSADSAYSLFCKNKQYENYFEECGDLSLSTEPFEYALLDINSDGQDELIIKKLFADFSFFAVFTYDADSGQIAIIPIEDTSSDFGDFNQIGICYGDVEYSKRYGALMFTRLRPYYVGDTAISDYGYYVMQKGTLRCQMSIGTNHTDTYDVYYYDGLGTISEEKYWEYIEECNLLDFKPVSEINFEGENSFPFTDVKKSAWFYNNVVYVIEKGMMTGTGTNTFEPNATTTRGMIVTILYRLEKEPSAGTSPFTDVDANQWYAKAVAWAAANGVVNGTSPTTFNPNDPITREQMAAILYRYASFKGYDVTGKADLAGYTDAAQISDYAKDAMSWANQAGLIGGVSATTLQPQGSAIRAQVATILMRFCENVVK